MHKRIPYRELIVALMYLHCQFVRGKTSLVLKVISASTIDATTAITGEQPNL